MTSKPETKPPIASAEDRLESSIGAWIGALETVENLVEGMNKKELRRAIKSIFAHPLEHDRVTLNGQNEELLVEYFVRRDVDKLNAALAQIEINGRELQLKQAEEVKSGE